MSFNSLKTKVIFLIATCVISMVILGRNLNPLSDRMTLGHDETQAARVVQYTLNIKEGHIPPRIAPDFSFQMGYPVFTYYAPFPYIITSILHLSGFNIVISLKLSYLLALSLGFIGMFLLLKRFVSFYPSLLGAVSYISSPFIATEIFVRSNLAEMWFFALFPISLYLLLTNSKKRFVVTSFVLSFLFTSHNIFSLFSIFFSAIFISLTQKRKINYLSFGMSILLSAYFYIPLFLQLHEVQSSFIATLTDYNDHFLCMNQLWTGVIGFAGSARGCELDGMSFMLGKLHIIFGLSGFAVFFYSLYKHTINKNQKIFVMLFAFVLLGSLLLPLQELQFLWQPFSRIAGIIQFPWRLLLLSVFGLAFFSAYLMNLSIRKWQPGILLVLIAFLVFNMKFFYGQTLSKDEYANRYFSTNYITRNVAFHVPEYLSTHVNYKKWKSYEKNNSFLNPYILVSSEKNSEVLEVENKPFRRISMVKSISPITLNIMFMPYWKITINNKQYIPYKFDDLGRPIVKVSAKAFDTIQVTYAQTPLEQIANLISLGTAFMLFLNLVSIFVPSWKNIVQKHIKI